MKIYDTQRIYQLSNNPDNFHVFFRNYIQQDEVDVTTALDVLRISGVYLSRFSLQPENEYNRNFKICIEDLLHFYSQESHLIQEFECQCKMMHDINNAFFSSIEGNNIFDKTKKKSRVLTLNFIILCEIYLSTIASVLENVDINKIKKTFPFFILPPNINLNEKHSIENIKTISRAFDEIASYTGKIFSYLRCQEAVNLNIKIDKKTLFSTSKYLNEWNLFDSLSRISDYFRLSKARISELNPREYRIDTDEPCLYLDYEVARLRLAMSAINLHNETQHVLKNNINSIVPSYLSYEGLFNAVYLSQLENMAPEDLHEEYGGVSLYDWVHAYQSLVTLSSKEIKKRFSIRKKIPLDASHWLIIKSRKNWILFFQKEGLTARAANIVTDYFTFNEKSQDLNDCPFILCEDGLCLMPALVSSSSATRSLMSLFGSKNIRQTSKGKFHEEQFLQQVLNAGITAKPIFAHKNYECDCVMLIDDNLIFTELKSNGHPIFYGKYYQTICNITGDHSLIQDNKNKRMRSYVEQVNRCAEHYIEHIDIIIKEFGLPDSWSPQGVHKLIVTTSILGGKYHLDNCFIIDKLSITSFFHRTPGIIYKSETRGKFKKIQQNGYEFCDGKITIDKLIGYLNTLPSINFTKKNVKKLSYNVEFGGKIIHYPYYDSWPGEPFIQTE